ncbi:hypothetical protein [Georgenia sp. SYP-B2076]|uniref:hypothetical protein n=1 Tax=Georgenia sp. SYP-B2076 TaxID=2495881 RepID=UPI000F8F38EC|nr:hypothetical protein [Georgenia sp. SYP-B2076]
MTEAPEPRNAEVREQPMDPAELPGVHRIIVGTVIAVLAPLFGFLVGSMTGATSQRDALQGLYLWLVGGIVLGGIGAMVAFVGALRLLRSRRARIREG